MKVTTSIFGENYFFSGRSRREHAKKRVSFSDPENDLVNDTLDIIASDSSTEQSAMVG